MNKAVDEILRSYPFITDDINKAQREINRYIDLQQQARDPLKAQSLDGMPKGYGVSDKTLDTVERLIDVYQAEIDKQAAIINDLIDRKKWLDMAIASLTEDEKRIIYLKYDERWPAWKIMHRMGRLHKSTYFNVLGRILEKINKIMFT